MRDTLPNVLSVACWGLASAVASGVLIQQVMDSWRARMFFFAVLGSMISAVCMAIAGCAIYYLSWVFT